ncbi:MAG: hypothetical protein Q9174_004461 [Haloplaca sp. 1 TL-2023]
MRLLAITLLTLTSFALADTPMSKLLPSDSFVRVNKQHAISKGCDVDIINVCGCTQSVNVDTWHTCDSNNRKHTQEGKVCEGWWKLEGSEMRLERNGCKAKCTMGWGPSDKLEDKFPKFYWCKAKDY